MSPQYPLPVYTPPNTARQGPANPARGERGMQGHSAVPAATRKRRGGGWAIALVLINTSGPPSMGTINYVTSLAEPVRAQQDRGWRDFTLCTRWARCPLRLLARGARRGRAAGTPASASPAAARWHKRAGQPRHHGRAEMGCPGWVSGRIHPAMLLCAPRPARGRWVAGTPPTAAWPRCALALLRAVVTAQRLHASALASWTFSRASGGASGAAVEENGAERWA